MILSANKDWYIPIKDKQNEINSIVDFMNNNATTISIITIILLISYFYFRNKINMKYLLDFILVALGLTTLYIILSPHRFQGLAYFITMSFR